MKLLETLLLRVYRPFLITPLWCLLVIFRAWQFKTQQNRK